MQPIHLIEEYLRRKDLSWRRLALMMGLSDCYFSKIRLEGRSPSQRVINQLAELLSEEELLVGELQVLRFKDAMNNLSEVAA